MSILTEAWRRRPPATVRLRLTALYGGLFLLVGTVLLTITCVLFARQLQGPGTPHRAISVPAGPPFLPGIEDLRKRVSDALAQQRADALRELIVQSGLALALVSVAAVALGWIVAGRVLRPLRDITATARRLSTHNLDERIALPGPRDELKELADTFDAMLGRLAAAFEAQRRFVANASHELRTPLTVQRAAVDVALADPRPTVESFRTMAERIRAATERHEHLVASLLTLAHSERGVEHYEEVDLAESARSALATAGPLGDLEIRHELYPALVRGDPALLDRLAANLIDNAVRHNHPGGLIEVRTGTQGGVATLRVVNTGPVVPPEEVGALFEPFRRLTPGRTGKDGHGLGLSIVAAVTAAHHGTRTACSRPGGGLDVTIAFNG
jgi:signal transduction histidine kinase